MIDFGASVSLNSQSGDVIIAANTVTIENNVTVTVTGGPPSGSPPPAQVYTNHPNYTGSGGNASTTGKFAGNGAITTPLPSAPPFDDTGVGSAASGGGSAASAKG